MTKQEAIIELEQIFLRELEGDDVLEIVERVQRGLCASEHELAVLKTKSSEDFEDQNVGTATLITPQELTKTTLAILERNLACQH